MPNIETLRNEYEIAVASCDAAWRDFLFGCEKESHEIFRKRYQEKITAHRRYLQAQVID